MPVVQHGRHFAYLQSCRSVPLSLVVRQSDARALSCRLERERLAFAYPDLSMGPAIIQRTSIQPAVKPIFGNIDRLAAFQVCEAIAKGYAMLVGTSLATTTGYEPYA